jgi:hypothetical protein
LGHDYLFFAPELHQSCNRYSLGLEQGVIVRRKKTMAGILRSVLRAGGVRLAVKTSKSIPLIGTVVAIGLIGYEVKKKGLVKGLVNTALDATPVLGTTKNVIEMVTGDWLPDKSGGQY